MVRLFQMRSCCWRLRRSGSGAGPFGDNGKSTTFEFLKKVFGRYAKTMPVKYLTSVRPDAGKADSVLMGMKGVRFAAMEEPDDGCKINAPLAAELTGGSTISGRDLFCANMEYRPQLVPNLACNRLPGIQNGNGGGRNRIRKYDYESRFVVGAEVDEENHVYPADPQINNKFQEWAMDCMLLLLDDYQHVYVEECPASVMDSTEEYMDRGNDFALFAKLYISKGRNSDCFKLQEAVSMWYDFVSAAAEAGQRVQGRERPEKEEFRQGLQTVLKTTCPTRGTKIGGVVQRNAFKGWVLHPVAQEIQD